MLYEVITLIALGHGYLVSGQLSELSERNVITSYSIHYTKLYDGSATQISKTSKPAFLAVAK